MIAFGTAQIPPEIFFSICQHLDVRDVLKLKQVSKLFHQIITEKAFNIFPEQAYREFAAKMISNLLIDTSEDNVNRIISLFLQQGYHNMGVTLSEKHPRRTIAINVLKKCLNENFKTAVSAELSKNLKWDRLILLIQSLAEIGLGKTYRLGLGQLYTGEDGIIELLNGDSDFPSYKEPFQRIHQFLTNSVQFLLLKNKFWACFFR